MKAKDIPSHKYLNKRFFYEAKTGILFWKKDNQKPLHWNTRFYNRKAGHISKTGYCIVRLDGCLYRAHRIIYSMYHKLKINCKKDIDHINGVKHDNTISNLRIATRSQNQQNSKPRTSLKGTYLNKAGTFTAQITVNKNKIFLGNYKTRSEAHRMYAKASNKYFKEFSRKN